MPGRPLAGASGLGGLADRHIAPRRFRHSQFQRIGDERVANRDFFDVWHRSQEGTEIVEIQIVSGIHSEPDLLSG